MRAVSLIARAMVRVGWVGVRRLDFDDARRLEQQVEAVEAAADDAAMAAIQHESSQ